MDLTLAKKEYFQLINFLNTGNTSTNKKTKMYFYFEKNKNTSRVYAALTEKQKILLCKYTGGQWKPARFSKFIEFEDYLIYFLNHFHNFELDLTEQVVSHLFQLPD